MAAIHGHMRGSPQIICCVCVSAAFGFCFAARVLSRGVHPGKATVVAAVAWQLIVLAFFALTARSQCRTLPGDEMLR